LSVNTIESIQGFIFYLIQYSISNLNGFIILLAIGYSLFYLINDNKEYKALTDKNNSPVQLVSQLKGYFYINPILSLSLTITIFSFAGIPPLLGFFAKLMVLSSALDSGYIFLTLIAILTSVISAVYYLNITKEIFFDLPEHKSNPKVNIINYTINPENNVISLSSYLTITISTLTLTILLFIIMPAEGLDMANILSLTLFNI
jgi:NADH-ubiquinone oxidoreductase chain 2